MKRIMEEIRPTVENVFEHLHTHPEISWEEVETTKYLKQFLESEGFKVETFNDTTGLVVTVGEGKPVIGIRTDIDALWQEVGGVYQANHSCGHDAHMTIAVGSLLAMKKLGFPEQGTLKVLFQPAEEKGLGALTFIDKGLIDDIDYLYGVHLRPGKETEDGKASPAIIHGAAKLISGSIKGTDAHGARPHEGQNAIEVMALLVSAIQSIHLNPMVPHSAKVTMFQAGGQSGNIIPGNGVFSIDARAQTNEVMVELYSRIIDAMNKVAQMTGVEISHEVAANIAAAQVDDTAVRLMAKAISETLGEEHLVQPAVTPGGEDFHFYTLKRPSVKATMLGLGCGLGPGLHHPEMTFNRERILTGIEIMVRTVQHTFKHIEQEAQHA